VEPELMARWIGRAHFATAKEGGAVPPGVHFRQGDTATTDCPVPGTHSIATSRLA
jgi:hypothetical protein